tara:strand:+ start:527 stop:823 length:297 start_codon:yes stop_codon:yes gene_type:complete
MFHNTSPYHRQVYHITDMDKVAPNRLQANRDNNNNYDHSITRKGGGSVPVPIYKKESITNPKLAKVKRFADERHRVAENRNQVRFHRTHSKLISRPYQ